MMWKSTGSCVSLQLLLLKLADGKERMLHASGMPLQCRPGCVFSHKNACKTHQFSPTTAAGYVTPLRGFLRIFRQDVMMLHRRIGSHPAEKSGVHPPTPLFPSQKNAGRITTSVGFIVFLPSMEHCPGRFSQPGLLWMLSVCSLSHVSTVFIDIFACCRHLRPPRVNINLHRRPRPLKSRPGLSARLLINGAPPSRPTYSCVAAVAMMEHILLQPCHSEQISLDCPSSSVSLAMTHRRRLQTTLFLRGGVNLDGKVHLCRISSTCLSLLTPLAEALFARGPRWPELCEPPQQ